MTNNSPSVFNWRKPKLTAEEEERQRRKKELRTEHNKKAQERSKRLTARSQLPMHERFNKMDKL